MSEKLILSDSAIDQLCEQHKEDPHFATIALPRLRLLNKLQVFFIDEARLIWEIVYSPINKATNCVRIHLNDPNERFAFYFEIPLMQRFDLHLYLGNNTFNFFEAHPLLIEKKVIEKDEFEVKATNHTLPHLDLNVPKARFERPLLEEEITLDSVRESQIYSNVSKAF
nr:hypothetical protein [uncultured Carboxylicivirga sp.]